MASNNKGNKNIPRVLDFEDDEAGVGGTSGDSEQNGSSSGKDAGVVDDSSYYGILNVPVDASEEDLKRSFRLLAAACHPDKVRDPDLRPAAADAFAKVQAAYEVSFGKRSVTTIASIEEKRRRWTKKNNSTPTTSLSFRHQILSDPEKRSIYDIYGKQGLEAGLQLGDKLKSTEELRKEWAAFQARRAAATLEARVAHRGAYVVKVDASGALLQGAPLINTLALPDLAGMAMSTQVQVPIGERAGATLGGQVATRRGGVGGGAFLAGVRRVVGNAMTVDVHAQLGLKQVLTLSSERQLDERTSSGFALSWQPPKAFFGGRGAAQGGISGMIQRRRAAAAAAALGGAASGGVLPPILRSSSSSSDSDDEVSRHGFGLTLTSGRRFSEKVDGDVSWTVGPEDAAGVSLGFTRRGESIVSSARLEVGAVTGVSARVVWRPARTPRLISFLFFSSPSSASSAASASANTDNENEGEPTELAEDIEEEEETGFASSPSAPSLALRASVRLNTAQGLELEIGFSKRLSEFAVAGVALAAGTSSGVTLRPRFSRGGHAFDFPILLARSVAPLSASSMLSKLPAEVHSALIGGGGEGGESDGGGEPAPSFLFSSSPISSSSLYEDSADPVALAILLLGPAACSAALQLLVLRPLRRRALAKRAALRREATRAQAEASVKTAEDAAKLLGPVARRRAAKEVAGALSGVGEYGGGSANGIVVIRARYGPVAALDAAARKDREEGEGKEGGGEEESNESKASSAAADEGEPAATKKELGSHFIPDFEATEGAAAAAAASGEAGSSAAEGQEPLTAGNGNGDEKKKKDAAAAASSSPSSVSSLLLPRFVDVTAATRLLVDSSSSTITLQQGATRHALLGFADPAPGERKTLEVLFVSSSSLGGGQVYRARVPDGAGAVLPAVAGAAAAKGSAFVSAVAPTHRDALAAVAEVESLVPGSGAKLSASLSKKRGSGSGGSGDGSGEQAKPRRRRFGIV